jgi:hypothetical protein
MENEKIIVVPNGLNDEFYVELIAQAESEADRYADMADAMIEQAESEADRYADMADAMIEQAETEADRYADMADAMIEQAESEADCYADMADAMIEQAETEADYYGGSVPDKRVDCWTAVYSDFSTKSSENINTLNKNNLLCFIHKKFNRTSKTGKTAYFSYHIVDENLQSTELQVGNYICKFAESEHWVAWDYESKYIKEQHYLTFSHQNNHNYKFKRTFFYPMDYTFASIITLHKYNPFNFLFKKLNFLSKNLGSSCGDKLARLVIFDTKDRFLELSIHDFENNIVPLLKELSNSVSFIDFVLKEHLKFSVRMKMDFRQNANEFMKVSFVNMKDNINKMLEQNSKFLPNSVKNNPNSEVTLLMQQYKTLIGEISNIL